MQQRTIFSVLATALVFLTCQGAAQEVPPAFTPEVQGEWHVLAAHQKNTNIATGRRLGSRVNVAANRVTWHDPENDDAPLVSARCHRATPPAELKKQADPNELTSTVTGSLCPKQAETVAARWRVTDNNVLLLLVEVAEFKGNRNGTYSGAAPSDVILICQRAAVPAVLKPESAADARRLIGVWTVLGEFDDANSARTRPQGNVEFTASDFFKRGTYRADAKPGMEGAWKFAEPEGSYGRIDLVFRSGIEGNQGRSPSLYAFLGDDLLMIVYPEGGWQKDAVEDQARRQPPTHFGSDGNRNLWILRRRPAHAK